MAELWIEEPVLKLVTRYRDLTATLAPGSTTSDVRAELIYVGRGDRESDYEGQDVRDKIVLASGPGGTVHDLAARKFQAAGVATFYNRSGEPNDRPDQIAWGRLTSRPGAEKMTAFGFVLSRRMGMELLELLRKTPKVMAHAKVKSAWYRADIQVVAATIPGDGSIEAPDKTEVVFMLSLVGGEALSREGAADRTLKRPPSFTFLTEPLQKIDEPEGSS